jgi:hypothetical protein
MAPKARVKAVKMIPQFSSIVSVLFSSSANTKYDAKNINATMNTSAIGTLFFKTIDIHSFLL